MERGCKIVPRKTKTLGNLLSPSESVEHKPRTWLSIQSSFPVMTIDVMYANLRPREATFVGPQYRKAIKYNSSSTVIPHIWFIAFLALYAIYLMLSIPKEN